MDTKLKLIILLGLFLLSPVSAKFICGEVTSQDIQSPSWYSAKVYLSSDKTKSSTCQVSPSNNRYCCELSKDKLNYQWKAGDMFKTQITDLKSNYFASPKNLTLSSQGYDIAPILTLQKAIQIISPAHTLTISKTPIQIQSTISPDCENKIQSNQNLTFGKNIISVLATCNDENFKTNKTVFHVKNLTFQKTFLRDFKKTSSEPKIRSKKTGTVNLQATLSHNVENIQLKEYVPSSWQIIETSNNATIEISTPKYNIITWQVTGNNFSFDYKVKAPEVGFRPNNYNFQTELDRYVLDEKTIQVYRFVPLPIKPKNYGGGYMYIPKYKSKVSQIEPLIYKEKDLTAALYSKAPKQQESLDLSSFINKESFDRKFIYLKSYQVQTTLNSSESGKMIMEYIANKTFMQKNNYKEIAFFEKHEEKFLRITGAVISSSENEVQYRFESSKAPSEIYIFAEKNSLTFLDKALNFLESLKFW